MLGASPGYLESSYEPTFMLPMPSYESTGHIAERSGQEMVAEPQVQWWVKKINEHNASNSAYKLRSVGSMRPTNLGATQPKGCRNKAREQRVKFQDQRLIPDVPRPLKYPSDMELAIRLSDLENSMDGYGHFWFEVRGMLRMSFERAFDSVNKAAQAHEELCKKTEVLKNNPEAMEKVKKAKIYTRDVLLWRWFGLTAWIYNQAESEFFQSYGREIESQLMNSVAKIRQRLMQNLMRRPCWHKLEKMLIQCAAEDSWTPELQGLLNRFHFTIESLGGLSNPVLQESRLSEDEEKELLEMEEQEAKEQAAEQEFEAEVWNNAGRKVSESVVGLLGLDDFDDFDLHHPHVDDAGPHAPLAMGAMGAFDEVDGDQSFAAVDARSAVQSTFWDPQYPNGQLPLFS